VEEATGRRTGAHVLHVKPEAAPLPEALRLRLLEARQGRPRPLRDDKLLTGWNGLMIAALARAGAVLAEPAWTEAARQAAEFLLQRQGDGAGRLLRGGRAGRSGGRGGGPAFSEDYAYLAWGLIELYEAGFEPPYLREAYRLTDELLAGFWEAESGGGAALYLSPREAETVLVRPRADHDGALPSAGSVAVLNLLRLARIGQRRDYEDKALALLRSLAPLLERHPRAFGFLLWGVDFHLGPPCEVLIAGDPGREDTRALAAAARREFLPHRVLLQRPAQADPSGRATAYVCRDYACRLPTSDPAVMLAQMRGEAGG